MSPGTLDRATGASRLRVVILISGRGSNMRAIAEHAQHGTLPIDIVAVISDKPEAAGLATASSLNIPTRAISPRDFIDREAFDAALAELIESFDPQLVVLAGFMRILTAKFIARFHDRILNIHPSLLPKYRGLHTHRRCLEEGDAQHGCSVHYVTAELDGGPVIIQATVPVLPGDTEATLSARVQQQEHRIYPEAIDLIARGRVKFRDDRVWLDGQPMTHPILIEGASG
ncbi:MAG TPA: phosphoribosylglycinamide formyltransferase [Steroidobacteraceae bacterium]|nr:phosphoribosylglycinamide formyltransferase [Steroidobacteraceae bacterium]